MLRTKESVVDVMPSLQLEHSKEPTILTLLNCSASLNNRSLIALSLKAMKAVMVVIQTTLSFSLKETESQLKMNTLLLTVPIPMEFACLKNLLTKSLSSTMSFKVIATNCKQQSLNNLSQLVLTHLPSISILLVFWMIAKLILTMVSLQLDTLQNTGSLRTHGVLLSVRRVTLDWLEEILAVCAMLLHIPSIDSISILQ